MQRNTGWGSGDAAPIRFRLAHGVVLVWWLSGDQFGVLGCGSPAESPCTVGAAARLRFQNRLTVVLLLKSTFFTTVHQAVAQAYIRAVQQLIEENRDEIVASRYCISSDLQFIIDELNLDPVR